MLLKLIRWLRGYVVFSISGKFPERFMNLCIRRGCFLFDATPIDSSGKIVASLFISDYKRIRIIARRSGVRLRILKKVGFPFFISRYKNRRGLAYGAVAFLVIIILMQNFIWTVEVNGVTTLSETFIETKLEEKGVYVGAFKGNKNLHSVERSIMQEVDSISWMSINLIGTKAEVEIKEKELKPHIIEAEIPCNVKAKSDGLIVSMDIKMGSTKLPVGSAVRKGELIVSGITKDALDNISFVHADAKVMAKTKHKASFSCEKTYSGKSVKNVYERKNFDFFSLSIPISLSNISSPYTSCAESFKLKLNNTVVPVGITKEKCTVYEDNELTVDRKIASDILQKEEALYRLFKLRDCREIEAKVKTYEDKSGYIYEVVYDCLEDIAVQENIIVN